MAESDGVYLMIFATVVFLAIMYRNGWYNKPDDVMDKRVAQDYVDSLSSTENSTPTDDTLKSIIKDLLSKIKVLERDKVINADKISSIQQNLSIDREQTKFLTSNLQKLNPTL